MLKKHTVLFSYFNAVFFPTSKAFIFNCMINSSLKQILGCDFHIHNRKESVSLKKGTAETGRHLLTLSGPTYLLKQGHLQGWKLH